MKSYFAFQIILNEKRSIVNGIENHMPILECIFNCVTMNDKTLQ